LASSKEILTAYIAELQAFFNPPVENNGIITLNLKQEIMDSYEKYRTYKSFLNSSKLKLFTEKFPGGGCIIKSTLECIYIDVAAFLKNQPRSVSNNKLTFKPKDKLGDRSCDIAFHVTRLQGYFQVTKADLAQSIKFLLSKGWNEKKFKELGISRATYQRYKVDRTKSKRKTQRAHKKISK